MESVGEVSLVVVSHTDPLTCWTHWSVYAFTHFKELSAVTVANNCLAMFLLPFSENILTRVFNYYILSQPHTHFIIFFSVLSRLDNFY